MASNSLTVWCFLKNYPCKAECQMWNLETQQCLQVENAKLFNTSLRKESRVPDQKTVDLANTILKGMKTS